MTLTPATPRDLDDLTAFLREVDLTVSGLDSPSIHVWIDRDARGAITGTTGFELSVDGRHALIRSVAAHPSHRRQGYGTELACLALDRATDAGATTAWLFSRRSGRFWQSLGFESADRGELAAALAETHQVQLFVESGQLEHEVAWSMALR